MKKIVISIGIIVAIVIAGMVALSIVDDGTETTTIRKEISIENN